MGRVQQEKSFRDLDCNVQIIISSLADGKKDFNNLSALINAENTSVKETVVQGFNGQTNLFFDRERCKAFIDSLYFPEILSRQERIADAHTQTFEWIFDGSGNKVFSWDSFVDWLEQGEGIYWINGKAGSGKSTLMSHIVQNQRTNDCLKTWSETEARSRELCVLKFFFWSAGSQMQKSTLGLLRSLTYQIVKIYPELTSLLAESKLTSNSRGIRYDSDQPPVWTERRLADTLQRVLRDKKSTSCFCFFIDGLDEFTGDQKELIGLIQNLATSSDVKLCVSSRPLGAFRRAFDLSPKLCLQDLTEPDIRKYISDKLPASLKLSTAAESQLWVSSVTYRIIAKAKGVFLWVNLAVKDQIAGIENEDTLGQLEERLERLPSEMEDLYAFMLERIDRVHRKEAALYFQIALLQAKNLSSCPKPSLFEVALMTFPPIDDLLRRPCEMCASDIIRHCRWTMERLNTTCVGLLEIHSPDMTGKRISTESEGESSEREGESLESSMICPIIEQSHSEEAEIGSYYQECYETEIYVDFLHRTTVDFLLKSNQGKEFLEKNTPAEFQYYSSQIKAILATLFVAVPYSVRGDAYLDQFEDDRIFRVMEIACAEECATGMSNTKVMNLIDKIFDFVDRHYLPEPPQSHWCTRWNFWFESSGVSRIARDFLGLATQFHVSIYVQEELATTENQPDPDRATYLLACALHVRRYWSSSQNSNHFALMGKLLEKGADPNSTISGTTLWHQFLQCMFRSRVSNKVEFGDLSWVWEVPFRNWLELALKFLQYGADVYGLVCDLYANSVTLLAQYRERSTPGVEIKFQMSPLSVIQWCLKGVSGFANVEDLCVVKGGSSYLKCISFKDLARPRGRDVYELSEQQSNEFCEVVKLALNAERTSRLRQELSAKILEICEEMKGRLDSEDASPASSTSSLRLPILNIEERESEGSSASDTHSIENQIASTLIEG